jgi:hypothetical protein
LTDISNVRVQLATGLGATQRFDFVLPSELPALLRQQRDLQFEALRRGPLVRHPGCAAHHPYYSDPPEYPIPSREAYQIGTDMTQVEHWLLGRLRSLCRNRQTYVLQNDEREMWFPLALLLAMNQEGLPSSVRGISMKLSGAKAAGKSLLSTMLLLPEHYIGHPGMRPGTVIRWADNYVYASPSGGAIPQAPFIEAFAPLWLLNTEQPQSRYVEPTQILTSNVRCMIFREALVNPNTGMAPLETLVNVFFGKGGQTDTYGVTIYDTAGEQTESAFDEAILSMDRHVQISTVVMDATRLPYFGSNDGLGFYSTMEQLTSAVDQDMRTCLVITKLDLVRRMDGHLSQYMSALEAGTPIDCRELLLHWLRRQGQRPNERQMAELLSTHREVPVFFVWTAMDPKEWQGRTTPKTYGIQRLVKWCLAPGSN